MPAVQQASISAPIGDGAAGGKGARPDGDTLIDPARLDSLMELFGPDKMAHYVDEFGTEARIRLDRMTAALNDQPVAASAAHDLCPLAGNLGLLKLCVQCRELMAAAADTPREETERRVATIAATVAESATALAEMRLTMISSPKSAAAGSGD